MNIGILGAGNLGTGLAKRLIAAGHQVMLSFSRDPAKMESAARDLGATTSTVAEATAFGPVVILATPYLATKEALDQTGAPPAGKIIWDCTNPLKPDYSGLLIGTTTSAGEQTAALAPWARVVKAIPPFAELLHADRIDIAGEKPGIFICGDDPEARHIIATLVSNIGAHPVDIGPLSLSRYIEPANMLLVALAYSQGLGTRIGLKLQRA